MSSTTPLDVCGRRRSPATLASFHLGRPPHNKGQRYPAEPPTIEEIIAVMHAAGDHPDGVRLRGLIVVLWRAGLRISEALALSESDLDSSRGAILVRRGKGGKRREVGMDRWAWGQSQPWLQVRAVLPVGALFCVLRGPTRGRPWAATGVRSQLHDAAARAGVRRRFAPHQLRHAHAVEMSRDGVPWLVIQRQLGHADLAITSVYLRGIDNTEIVHAVHERPAPMIPATHGLWTLWGSCRQRGRPRKASNASQVGTCWRGPIRMRPPSASCFTVADSPSFSSRVRWTWARSMPVRPW
jgi:integrase